MDKFNNENEIVCTNCKKRKLPSLSENKKAKIDDSEVHNHNSGHTHENAEVKLWKLILGLTFIAIDLLLFVLTITNVIPGSFETMSIWIDFFMATVIFYFIGRTYLSNSINSLKHKEVSEDTLIIISTTTAYIYSIVILVLKTTYFTSLSLPLFFFIVIDVQVLIYIGRYIESFLTKKTSSELNYLKSLFVKVTTVLRENEEMEIPLEEVVIGDIAIVKNGESIPLDGIIISGSTTINESSFTGESIPIFKEVGDEVYGGSISIDGFIKVEILKSKEHSVLGEVISGINRVIESKPKLQKKADVIAKYLVPSVLLIALLSFITIGLLGQFTGIFSSTEFNPWIFAFLSFITVLVVACPCSFSMTTPLSILVASSYSTKKGILFSSKSIFEKINDITAIAFDKTGTLTEGKMTPISNTLNKELLHIIYSGEKLSSHPIATSIINNFEFKDTLDVQTKNLLGLGIEITYKKEIYKFGSIRYVNSILKNYVEAQEIIEKNKEGKLILYLFNDHEVLGYIEFEDKIKDSSFSAIERIQGKNLDIYMITGDNKHIANFVADKLGIKEENVFAEVLPQDKYEIIKQIQEKGIKVAFVGDGVNDSIALKQADLGISIGEGTDIAIESSDIVLKKNDLNLIEESLEISRLTIKNINRGFTIAITYNAIIIPLTALGILTLLLGPIAPIVGAFFMFINDTLALFNALFLKVILKIKGKPKNN